MILSVSLLLIAVVSYLLGGVNGAIIMSKLVYHDDIRKSGSNNPGFTNFKRVYGLNAAASQDGGAGIRGGGLYELCL